MTYLIKIRRLLMGALQCAALAAALSGGAAYAADETKHVVLNGDAKCTKCGHDKNDS